MDSNVVTIPIEGKRKREAARKVSHFADDVKAEYLLSGTDGHGQAVYYFRMNVTGLRCRIFGPFDSRSKAIKCFDVVLDGIRESFVDGENEGDGQVQFELPTDLKPVRQ